MVKMSKKFRFLQRLRKKVEDMAKNATKSGRSVRNGNRASPYRKYNKVPYRYSTDYYAWRAGALRGAVKYIRANSNEN